MSHHIWCQIEYSGIREMSAKCQINTHFYCMLFSIKSNKHTVEMSLEMEMSNEKKRETLRGFMLFIPTLLFL